MRGLTQKERRELKKELIKSGFDMGKLRIVADWAKYEGLFVVGFNCMDRNISQRICIPFKDVPDIRKIEKQIKKIAPEVFIGEKLFEEDDDK